MPGELWKFGRDAEHVRAELDDVATMDVWTESAAGKVKWNRPDGCPQAHVRWRDRRRWSLRAIVETWMRQQTRASSVAVAETWMRQQTRGRRPGRPFVNSGAVEHEHDGVDNERRHREPEE